MYLSIYLLLLSKILSSWAQLNPEINFISKNQDVSLGDTVDLKCSVQYARDYPILWVKINDKDPSGNLFISSGSTQHVPGNRFSIRHDEASSTFTLQITKIQETDAGHYQCQVILGPTTKVSKDVWVRVKIAPSISDKTPRQIATNIGHRVEMDCEARGYPTPRVSWRRANSDLLPTGGTVHHGNTLIVHSVSPADRGTYYCIAENDVGPGAQRSVVLEVEFPPVVRVPRPRFGQALGSYIDLECQVEAYPSPAILWLKDHTEVVNDQHHRIHLHSPTDDTHASTLRISDLLPEHYGEYVCYASNRHGEDRKSVQLFRTENVVCPPDCGIGASSLLSPEWQTFLATLGAFFTINMLQ